MSDKNLSYNDQLNEDHGLPQVVIETDPRRIKMFKGDRLLLPGALEVSDIMGGVALGRLITKTEIRSQLALKHNADYTCPVTTEKHIMLSANASAERDHDRIPYWRTLKADGQINQKYPGGLEFIKAKLIEEGFEITQTGNKYVVKDYKNYL